MADDTPQPAGEQLVPLAFIERLERAQLEILAIQLWREDTRANHIRIAKAWQDLPYLTREHYRINAHRIMQGEEPLPWSG